MSVKLLAKTNQQAFEMSYLALMRQGERSSVSIDGNVQCKYDGGNGLACAVGHLVDVTDRANLDYIEIIAGSGTAVDELVEGEDLDIGGVNVNLLTAIQCAHDSIDASNSEDFREQLTKTYGYIGKARGLTLPEYKND